jgi:hypothetical protein
MQILKKLFRKTQTRAIGFEFTTRRGKHVSGYVTWLGVFLWTAVMAWLIFT